MKKANLNHYITLGSSIRFLLDVQEGMPIHKAIAHNELPISRHFDRIFEWLPEMGFLTGLRAITAQLGGIKRQLAILPEDAKLTESMAKEINSRTRVVANIIQYESGTLSVYVIPEKRLPAEKLMHDISGLMAQGVFEVLPDLTQYDFAESGKCIALELPTASAFHVLRGTEGLLRAYYLKLVPYGSAAMWASIVNELRNITNPPLQELLDNLDNIRKSFRNPTAHPEKRYDIDEAQDLFNLCVDVTNRMVKDLVERELLQKGSTIT